MMNNIKKIQGIYKSFGKVEPFDWLDGRSYSDAFVICLAAGPWRILRRTKIQQEALNKLNGRDLLDIDICNGVNAVITDVLLFNRANYKEGNYND